MFRTVFWPRVCLGWSIRTCIILVSWVATAWSQDEAAPPPPSRAATTPVDTPAAAPVGVTPRPTKPAGSAATPWSAARGSKSLGTLPSQQGQVWQEHDLREYTSRVTTTSRPEQAIIDWILRETGTEVWFSEPLGVLNANRDTLRVYHTPEMQQLIHDLVERFIKGPSEPLAFGIRLVTVGNPNWRAKALPYMQSLAVQSPGIDAWLLSKENAAMLLTDLRRRADFKEQNAPTVAIFNGQSQTISRLRPRNYVRSAHLTSAAVGFELETAQIQEGYSLQVSPLLSLDGKSVDAVIKCQVDQVERLISIPVEVPAGGKRQSVQVQVPQLVTWRMHERFRWPAADVLVLSCGVVATPTDSPATSNPLTMFTGSTPQRADAVVFIESSGIASRALLEASRG
ncbi:MAG: hypothetical protein ACKV0T_27045, partial [Planctomycetales bacterium]